MITRGELTANQKHAALLAGEPEPAFIHSELLPRVGCADVPRVGRAEVPRVGRAAAPRRRQARHENILEC
jgi:hypothetical protein